MADPDAELEARLRAAIDATIAKGSAERKLPAEASLADIERVALATYFRQHTRRMQYQEFHEQDYPIGSGTIECGIKRFRQRLAGPGMRWSRPAADRMLVLRAAILSGTFDQLWADAKN